MTASITDFNQFTGLHAAAEKNDPAALREVASQFEALFLQTMLKNMREASLGDDLMGGSDQQEMYQGMMDQQLALEMASGKGVGLAEMLVRQLGGDPATNMSRPDRNFYLTDVPRSSPVASVKPAPTWSDPKTFAQDIWPHAERAGRRLKVAPEAIVAQAALETGWGKHVMSDGQGASSFNLFGIKVGTGWRGDQVSRQTLEFENGIPQRQNALFRSYNDVAATFEDYTNFLSDNPRYSTVSGHGGDVAGFARALQDSGYATDPQYADKLTRIIESPTMRSVMLALKNSVAQPITAQLSLRAQ